MLFNYTNFKKSSNIARFICLEEVGGQTLDIAFVPIPNFHMVAFMIYLLKTCTPNHSTP